MIQYKCPYGAGAARYGRRFASPLLFRRGLLKNLSETRRGGRYSMVTYEELFLFVDVLIGVINLLLLIFLQNKKK